jgi:SAM-dependent methyltransferase
VITAAEIEQAIRDVTAEFPFPGYIEASPRSHYETAATAARYLDPGARILDFAAGPLDKTAVLQRLGFRCSAYDDLSDAWHDVADNREAILRYARSIGIDYVLPPAAIPEGPFDMVMAHDVLEHLHESPRAVLGALLDRTADDGLLFVTVPNAANLRKRMALVRGRTNLPSYPSYFWYEGTWRGHIREYVRDDLEQLADLMQIDVLELRGTHHLAYRLPGPVRVPYLALTKAMPSLRDTWLLVGRKRAGWCAPDGPSPAVAEELLRAQSPYWMG